MDWFNIVVNCLSSYLNGSIRDVEFVIMRRYNSCILFDVEGYRVTLGFSTVLEVL